MFENMEDKLQENKEEEDSKEVSNIVGLHSVASGGYLEGPWLASLEVGCNFLAKFKKKESSDLYEYWIVTKTRRAVKLILVQGDTESIHWVDPVVFSKEYSLFEILEE